jgi:hypothetical protein
MNRVVLPARTRDVIERITENELEWISRLRSVIYSDNIEARPVIPDSGTTSATKSVKEKRPGAHVDAP